MMDRESSPAFRALPRSTRRVLDAIESSIDGGRSAAVSYNDFMFTYHCGRQNISRSIKLLDRLGLIEVRAGPRCRNIYALSERWPPSVTCSDLGWHMDGGLMIRGYDGLDLP
jgi:hypothetical protein